MASGLSSPRARWRRDRSARRRPSGHRPPKSGPRSPGSNRPRRAPACRCGSGSIPAARRGSTGSSRPNAAAWSGWNWRAWVRSFRSVFCARTTAPGCGGKSSSGRHRWNTGLRGSRRPRGRRRANAWPGLAPATICWPCGATRRAIPTGSSTGRRARGCGSSWSASLPRRAPRAFSCGSRRRPMLGRARSSSSCCVALPRRWPRICSPPAGSPGRR